MIKTSQPRARPLILRVATFNVAFSRTRPVLLAAELTAGHLQAQRVSKIIPHSRPDILLLNEFVHDGVKKDDQHLTLLSVASAGVHIVSLRCEFAHEFMDDRENNASNIKNSFIWTGLLLS